MEHPQNAKMSGLKFCANLTMMFNETGANLLEKYALASAAGFKVKTVVEQKEILYKFHQIWPQK